MARTATRKTGGFDFKAWAKAHDEEIRIGAVAAAVAFFFTHGLPLWDDDYGQWLAQAKDGIFHLIGRILLPVTTEPQTWGYSDRPVQVLIYKILHLLLGFSGIGFFFVKSLVFGGLVGTLYHLMGRNGIDRKARYLALALFVVSTNTLASLIWHSDFGVHSQLVLALVLLYALPQIESGPASVQVYSKGFDGLPKGFVRFLLVFFAAVYVGAKLKGDVRLAPVILLAYLAIFDREKAKVYAAPFGITFLATLPWSGAIFSHLPPFVPGAAGYQGWTYGTFSVPRVIEFIAGDALNLRGTPLSLVGAVGILVALGAAVYGGYRLYLENLRAPDRKWGFYLVWLGVALLACGTLAPQNQTFQIRYTLIPLVPATILVGMILHAALREFGKHDWFEPAVIALVAAQCGLHFYHDYHHRRDMGHTMVAVNRLYQVMEEKHGDAQLLFNPGFLPYAYKDSAQPAISNRKALGNADEIRNYPAGRTYVASWGSTLDPKLTLETVLSGCGSSLFDLISPCGPTDGALLLKYVGDQPEVAQAYQLDSQGNLGGARQSIESYLKKDPSNHGALFMAGLYAYRQGDFARMEQAYDEIGPFFPEHPAVVYNWALAKQGQQRFGEAAHLFEHAHHMAPREYGIGFNLAETYYKLGKKTRALATLDELMKIYPDNQAMKSAYEKWSK